MDADDATARLSLQPHDSQRLVWARYHIPNIGDYNQLAECVEELWGKMTSNTA